jgi:hypothetical protein
MGPERDSLAAESAKAYRQKRQVNDIADRLDGRDAATLRTVAAYLREREVATREQSDALSRLLGLDPVRSEAGIPPVGRRRRQMSGGVHGPRTGAGARHGPDVGARNALSCCLPAVLRYSTGS